MELRPRSEWGARVSKGCSSWTVSNLHGVCIHWWGSPTAPSSQDGMPALLRSVQSGHMAPGGLGAKDGGCDIAYNFIVDLWGGIWTGRGWNIRTGANGDFESNSTHLAIAVAMGVGDRFTDQAARAVNWLIAEARRKGVGSEVRTHKSFTGSDCPGPEIIAWIASGRPVEKENEDLPLDNSDIEKIKNAILPAIGPHVWEREIAFNNGEESWWAATQLGYQTLRARQTYNAVARLEAAVAALAQQAGCDVDEEAVAAAVLTVLTPAAIAAALPADVAKQVADEIAARLAG